MDWEYAGWQLIQYLSNCGWFRPLAKLNAIKGTGAVRLMTKAAVQSKQEKIAK